MLLSIYSLYIKNCWHLPCYLGSLAKLLPYLADMSRNAALLLATTRANQLSNKSASELRE